MIFENNFKYKFSQPILKIHYLWPAFNDSVVMIAQKSVGKDILLHFDQKSNLVFKFDKFDARSGDEDFCDTLCMPNDKEVILLRPEDDIFYHFNLQTKDMRKIRHNYMTDVSCQCDVNFFCKSNYLCIYEKGDHQMYRLHFTYYEWPFKFDQPQPQNSKEQILDSPRIVTEFDEKEMEGQCVWHPGYLVRKANSHSKYVWNETRFKDEFVIRIHEVVNRESCSRLLKISMDSLFRPYNCQFDMEAAIVEMWEMRPDVILLFTATSKHRNEAVNQYGIVNNTFIWDTKENTIRESEFVHKKQYQDLQVDMIGSSELSMFPTFMFADKKRVESPTIFVNNATEQIIKTEMRICDHTQKYTILESNPYTIIEGIYENIDVQELQIRTISLCDRRDMSLFLLFEMESKQKNGWDMDLIKDIMDRLDYEELE